MLRRGRGEGSSRGREEGWWWCVCAHTRSRLGRGALDRIDMFGTRLLRLRIRRTSTRQYTLLRNRKSPRVRRRALCKLSEAPSGASIIARGRILLVPFVPLIEFAKNSGEAPEALFRNDALRGSTIEST